MPKTIRNAANVVVAAAVLLIGCIVALAPANSQPVEIRIGWNVPPPLQMVPIWTTKPGITVHHGKSYVLKPVYFRGSPLMITALAANEVDVVMLGPSQMNLAVANAGFNDLRIIADEILDGHPGYYSTSYFVLKDSGINSPADLKGKAVATFAIGSSTDIAARNYLQKQGLDHGRDYSILEAAPPNQKALLFEKKAAIAALIPPYAYDPEVSEKARVLFTARDGYGKAVSAAYWQAREGFIAKNRAAMVDMLEDYLRLGRWYWNPANRKDALQIVSDMTKAPVSALEGFSLTNKDAYRPPDEIPDLESGQLVIQAQKRLGLAKGEIDLKAFADLSMIKEAAQRLK